MTGEYGVERGSWPKWEEEEDARAVACVLRDEQTGIVYKIRTDVNCTIGKKPKGNRIRLSRAQGVSDYHAVLDTFDKVTLLDRRSTGGVYVGKKRRRPFEESGVGDGSIVSLGDYRFKFYKVKKNMLTAIMGADKTEEIR